MNDLFNKENQLDRIEAMLIKLTAPKKPVKTRGAKKHVYSPVFLGDWKAYPDTSGANKAKAHTAWMKRISEGEIPAIITLGVMRYAEYIKATGRWVMLPATFFGPDKHYENEWTCPIKDVAQKVPRDDNQLSHFAVKHNLRNARPGENFHEYRQYIEGALR